MDFGIVNKRHNLLWKIRDILELVKYKIKNKSLIIQIYVEGEEF
jgi:hypothetical protein